MKDKYIKDFKEYSKQILLSRDTTVKFMQDLGVLDRDEKLTTNYK